MTAKEKFNFIYKYALINTIFVALIILLVIKLNNSIVTFASFFVIFILAFFIFQDFSKKIRQQIFNEFQASNKTNISNKKPIDIEEWTKQTEEEIAQLKANEQFRKEFIGNVAHELKTPVFNIQGFISTLLEGAINDPEVNIKYLERTDRNVQRLLALVKDLDTISKLETGQLKPDYSIFNIKDVIDETFDILQEKAQAYKIRLINKITKPIFVKADKEKITEVLHNLLLNSIIYGKKEGFTEIDITEKENQITISIKDNGIGIEEKHLKHIFERFYRVDKSRSRERGGSGLGLSIVKHIIDTHNQKINVKSKIGEGTTFYFTLEKIKNHSQK